MHTSLFELRFRIRKQVQPLKVLFVCLGNISVGERRAKFFWILMGLGFGIWLLAQVLWTYFEVVLRREVPNPFVGDVILFLHLVPMMGAPAAYSHLIAPEDHAGKPAREQCQRHAAEPVKERLTAREREHIPFKAGFGLL